MSVQAMTGRRSATNFPVFLIFLAIAVVVLPVSFFSWVGRLGLKMFWLPVMIRDAVAKAAGPSRLEATVISPVSGFILKALYAVAVVLAPLSYVLVALCMPVKWMWQNLGFNALTDAFGVGAFRRRYGQSG